MEFIRFTFILRETMYENFSYPTHKLIIIAQVIRFISKVG